MSTNTKQYISLHLRLTVVVLLLGLMLNASPALADTITLGEATNYNVFVFGDFTSKYSDTEGRLAVGGNMSVSGYGVASKVYNSFSGPAVVVGGDLTISNSGSPQGGAEVGGTAYVPSWMSGITDNVSDLPVDFEQALANLTALSESLANLDATGTATLNGSSLDVVGDGVSLTQVIYLTAEDLEDSNTWAYLTSIPSDASIIFNVSGETINWTNSGTGNLSLFSDQILFNFYEATVINLSGISIEGSFLAPYADVVGNNGQFNGTLVANSFEGNMEFHSVTFAGADVDLPSGSTPEPATLLLFGSALGGVAWLKRRRSLRSAGQTGDAALAA